MVSSAWREDFGDEDVKYRKTVPKCYKKVFLTDEDEEDPADGKESSSGDEGDPPAENRNQSGCGEGRNSSE